MISYKLKIYILISLVYFNFLAWSVVINLSNDNLKIIFFDIGQGDSIFIETPNNNQILIDGGPDDSVLEKLGQNMPFYDRTINLIILTHPDHDHIAGLLSVLKNYRVDNILWTGLAGESAELEEWKKLITKEGANIKIAQAGQMISEDNVEESIRFSVLYPFESLEGKTIKNANDSSIIIKLVSENKSFLFCGDASKSVERELINNNVNIDSDILKISHHGSKNSTSEEFLKSVSPDLAVISVGEDNSYGHPSSEVLVLLEKYDIKFLRTDLNGDIKIIY